MKHTAWNGKEHKEHCFVDDGTTQYVCHIDDVQDDVIIIASFDSFGEACEYADSRQEFSMEDYEWNVENYWS